MTLCSSSRRSLGVEGFGAVWGGTGVSGQADVGGQPFRKHKRPPRVPGSVLALRRDDLRPRPALTSG